jgi:hypothetical protein
MDGPISCSSAGLKRKGYVNTLTSFRCAASTASDLQIFGPFVLLLHNNLSMHCLPDFLMEFISSSSGHIMYLF